MKTHFAFGSIQLHRLLLGVVTLLGIATLLGAAVTFFPRASAVARPEVPPNPIRSIVGQWRGSFQSAIDRTFRGVVVLEITEQQHGHIGGNISADVFAATLRCKGTISARNEVQLVIERGGHKLTAEGELTGDSMRLQYRAVLSDGPDDDGTLTLARRTSSESVDRP
jgi:hypothetical protein